MENRPSPTSLQQRTLDRLGARIEYVCADRVVAATRGQTGRREQRFFIRADGSLESGRQHLDAAERRDIR